MAYHVPTGELPNTKVTSRSAGSETAAAGHLTGARLVHWQNTANGAVTLTTRTATEMFGDTTGAYVGLTWTINIASRGDNTVTFAGGAGVTTSGTLTVATGTSKMFFATFTSATACTITPV
jgi:hypothetical protein